MTSGATTYKTTTVTDKYNPSFRKKYK